MTPQAGCVGHGVQQNTAAECCDKSQVAKGELLQTAGTLRAPAAPWAGRDLTLQQEILQLSGKGIAAGMERD